MTRTEIMAAEVALAVAWVIFAPWPWAIAFATLHLALARRRWGAVSVLEGRVSNLVKDADASKAEAELVERVAPRRETVCWDGDEYLLSCGHVIDASGASEALRKRLRSSALCLACGEDEARRHGGRPTST